MGKEPSGEMPDLRYPIGRYRPPATIDSAQRGKWIEEVAALPDNLRGAVKGLDAEQLATPYRPGGWTVRQVVHHLPDSHLNSYVRFKLALSEETPTVNAYDEAVWAEMPDAREAPIEISLALLDALHTRWVMLLKTLDETQFARTFNHPERGPMKLEWTLGLYAWHSRHHVEQIKQLRSREGWI